MSRRCGDAVYAKATDTLDRMGDAVFLSWVAIAISLASATAGVVSARAAREATRLQKDEHKRRAVRLVATIDEAATDNVHWALRITNSGHKSVRVTNFQIRDDPKVWDRMMLHEVGADGGSILVHVARSDFTVKVGQVAIIEWAYRPMSGEKRKTVKTVL